MFPTLCLGVIGFWISSSAQAQTPAFSQSCDNEYNPFVGEITTEADKISDILNKDESVPFVFACQEPNALSGRPPTALNQRSIPAFDKRGNRAIDFLRLVQEKVARKITENGNVASAIQRCLPEGAADADCKIVDEWRTTDVPKYLEEARYHLALAQGPEELLALLGDAKWSLNYRLTNAGTFKAVNWRPLRPNEKKIALSTLNSYRDEIAARAAPYKRDFDKWRQIRNDAMKAARYRHFQTYHDMLATFPLMQYIDSDQPSREELQIAVAKLESNIKTERNLLDKWKGLLSAANADSRIDPDLAQLMNYSKIVEETLLEHPEFCGIATSILYTANNRMIGNGLMLSLPIMAVSFFIPPSAAIIAGLSLGATSITNAQEDFDATKARTLSRVETDSDDGELDELESSRRFRDRTVIAAPTVVANRFILGKVGQATLQSTKFGLGLAARARPGIATNTRAAFRAKIRSIGAIQKP